MRFQSWSSTGPSGPAVCELVTSPTGAPLSLVIVPRSGRARTCCASTVPPIIAATPTTAPRAPIAMPCLFIVVIASCVEGR